MGQLFRWGAMIKWDEMIGNDMDDFSAFLQNYWNLTQTSTCAECGDDWADEDFALTKAYLFLFGVVNWYGRKQKLSIPETYAVYMEFLVSHVGLPQQAARELAGHLSLLVESSDAVQPFLQAGEQSVQKFVDGNLNASKDLAKTLRTQKAFGIWCELSGTNNESIAAAAF